MDCPLALVRSTAAKVASSARHVTIDHEGIARLITAELGEEKMTKFLEQRKFDFESDLHGQKLGDESTAQYLLVVDAINFCFWPDGELEYEHLAGNLKRAVVEDPTSISAERLAGMTGEALRGMLGWARELPQEEERARLLREVGKGLALHFGGKAANLVLAANRSASSLVALVVQHFPGFRDHAIHEGEQVFLYKRAQIFAADLWGAFAGASLGAFDDVAQLTMFADYRVPVTLKEKGVMRYSEELEAAVQGKQVMEPGCLFEVEIRACTVHAVELIKAALTDAYRDPARVPMSLQLDWWLWRCGEDRRDVSEPHHRVRTIYY